MSISELEAVQRAIAVFYLALPVGAVQMATGTSDVDPLDIFRGRVGKGGLLHMLLCNLPLT